MTVKTSSAVNSDSFVWFAPYGGSWTAAANWIDSATGGAGAVAPGASNAVTIVGGTTGFTDVVGPGAAARLSVENDVLLWGTVTVAGAVTLEAPALGSAALYSPTDFDLDTASLSAASLSVSGGTLEVGEGSALSVSGLTTLNDAYLGATNGSVAKFGTLIVNSLEYEAPSTVAVDDNSSIEVGNTGGAALGAVTIDKGQVAAIGGSLFGNVVVNGTLEVEAGSTLTIDVSDPFGAGQSVTGSGALVLSENSTLDLGVLDGAAIQFGAPGGDLVLGAIPSGTITGFGVGDVIQTGTLATGLTFASSATGEILTLTKGGKAAGTLTLTGTYAGDLFHLSVNSVGHGSITMQAIGVTPVPLGLIVGTVGYDNLVATGNQQTLTGLGGGDSLSGGTFTGITFQDTSANLSGSSLSGLALSDMIDLTDMKSSSAVVAFVPGVADPYNPLWGSPGMLTVTDGTHTAVLDLFMSGTLAAGYFAASSDGATGTDLKYVLVNTDAYTFSSGQGGGYGVASNWKDMSTGATPVSAPSYGNAVSIGGTTSGFTDITGNGVAARLSTSGDVLLLGTVTLGTQVTGVSGALTQNNGTLALDGGASLVLTGTASLTGELEVGGKSTVRAGGAAFNGNGASLLVYNGSSVRFAAVNTYGLGSASVISVDATSSIEFGEALGAATGALTIDAGVTASLLGTVNGNIVVNGTLEALGSGGTLTIGSYGTAAPAVSGTGTLELSSGASLTLDGSDSAAILFAAPYAYGNNAETLTLAGGLPTGTISGFASGDVIDVSKTVTSVTYSQSGANGTLTLFDDGSKVGTLSFAGTYSAAQFQVELAPGGQSSSILYAPTPSTTQGSPISSNSDTYSWTNGKGGLWSGASNWQDGLTMTAAMSAPGVGNAVTIQDISGVSTIQIISGSGSAASVTVGGYMPLSGGSGTVFTGSLSVTGSFSNGGGFGGAGFVGLSGATFSVGSLNNFGALQISGGSNLTIGDATSSMIDGSLYVLGKSSVKVATGSAPASIGGTVSVDGNSSFEIGSAGTAAAGTLTIDSGQSITLFGTAATIAANLVVNGTLVAEGGLIEGFGGTVGSISGSGTIDIGSGMQTSRTVVAAADSAVIAFQNEALMPTQAIGDTVLELKGPLPTGAISGFVSGDSIQVDQTVTGVSFKQGILTLSSGTLPVGTLALGGSFTGSLFHVDTAAASGFATITVQAQPGAAGTSSVSTTKDAYGWTGASGGVWSTAANWTDATTRMAPTTVAGSGDAVTIAGGTTSGAYVTIGGNGAAASLAVSGEVLLTGTVAVAGNLGLTTATSQTVFPVVAAVGELALDAKASLTAGSAAIAGTLQAWGGSSASIGGTTTLTGGTLVALNGSTIQVGGIIANGNNDVIAVDATSVVKIGSGASSILGAVNVAAGATAALSGSIYGNVVANGTISVVGGGALWIDATGLAAADPYSRSPTIGGSGLLSITANSTLGLGAADSAAISFAGPNSVLVLGKVQTGTISGFAAGDQIEIEQGVTGVSYKAGSGGTGTLTLTNAAGSVGTLTLAGSYSSSAFHLDAAADGGSAVITLQSLGVAVTPPRLIQATAAAELLTATANGQTITGGGGGDTLSGGKFTGLDFKDLSANLNGSVIRDFAASDIIDFRDLLLTGVKYSGGTLTVSNATHTETLSVGFATVPMSGSFHIAGDGGSGSKVTWS